MTRLHHFRAADITEHYRQSNFTALKFSVFHLFIPLCSQPLATTDLLIGFTVLPFPQYHIVRIIQYAAFID